MKQSIVVTALVVASLTQSGCTPFQVIDAGYIVGYAANFPQDGYPQRAHFGHEFPRPPYLHATQLPAFGRVAFATDTSDPDIDLSEVVPDRMRTGVPGAVGGAAAGYMVGMLAFAAAISTCIVNPAVCPSLGAFVAGGAVAGGAAGVASAEATARRVGPLQADARETIASALRNLRFQQALQAAVYSHARGVVPSSGMTVETYDTAYRDWSTNYRTLRSSGIDTVVETGMSAVAVRGGNLQGQAMIVLSATVRLIRVSTGAVLHEAKFRSVSPPLTPAQWSERNGEAVQRALNDGVRDLAEQIVDHLFLAYAPGTRGDESVPCVTAGLAPLYPMAGPRTCARCGGDFHEAEFTPVDSLQPQLRWQPAASDRPRDGEAFYEIRIIEAARGLHRDGKAKWAIGAQVAGASVASPEYRPEHALKPCTNYFWTYRARFALEGQARATEWAGGRDSGEMFCNSHSFGRPDELRAPIRPMRYYYRFRTPCPGTK